MQGGGTCAGALLRSLSQFTSLRHWTRGNPLFSSHGGRYSSVLDSSSCLLRVCSNMNKQNVISQVSLNKDANPGLGPDRKSG